MAVELTDEDLEFLLDLVNSEDVRDSSGYGNNAANPSWGAADQPFIRLTAPSYADGVSAPRETVNTPREISDILVDQDTNGDRVEESIPNPFGGNAFLTFFGQYFDHGLDFVAKSGSTPIGSTDFPINAQRANIAPGTGNADAIAGTADDVPAQHINRTSPFVDQNQAYGSHDAVTDLLRRWEPGEGGQAVQTAYLLTGNLDDTGRGLLPTLNHIRDNYRVMTGGQELTAGDISNFDGTGQALLIDFIPSFKASGELDLDGIGHYYVAGDGRANENVMLTSIHTIWARNHNFWVDELKAKTGDAWTEEQYFQAARVINIAEYQRVVFTEFADAMAGGLNGGGTHGFGGYDPQVNAAISAEFAHVAYRFGHSMLNETVSYVDGATGELADISLVQAFLSPQKVGQLGVANLIQGATAVEHQAIDVHVVNALRNQLVGRPLDLAALNIFRGRDTGVGTLNEVRAGLFARSGDNALRPYEDWDDFQSRNDLSDELMEKLKAAYPEGFEAVDLWVGGLLERAREGQLGSTFAWIFLEQLDRLQEGDRFYYLEQLDDADFRDQINDQTFAEIVARNTGLTNLPANIFEATPLANQPPVDPPAPGANQGTPGDDVLAGLDGPDTLAGGDGDDEIFGLAGNDELSGGEGNDFVDGGEGNDALNGDGGADELHGGAGRDELHGGAGNDDLRGGAGNDELYGDGGQDVLHGDGGNDLLDGAAGNDELEGGEGDDTLEGGAGQDLAIFSDIRANYRVVTDEDGETIVTHLNGGSDGTDTLRNIEKLHFADDTIATPLPAPGPDGEPPAGNTAPSATAIGGQLASPGTAFSLNAAAHFADPDAGDALTYSMTGPAWLSINAQAGVITGTPPVHTARQELAANANGGYALPAGGSIEISTALLAKSSAYENSFGYYLADANGKPIGGAIIENSARAIDGQRTATIDLDDHPGAVSLGFFIIPDGAKNHRLADGDAVEFKQTGGVWSAYIGGCKLQGKGADIFFSDTALNADQFDHLKDTGDVGNQNWEDLRGGGDRDFNDVNVQVSVKALHTATSASGGQIVVTATDKAGAAAYTSFQIGIVPGNVTPAQLAGAIHIEDATPADGALTALESQPLSAVLQPLFDPASIADIRYQWQSSANGDSWRPIPGATNARFIPRQSEFGLSLRVALTYIFIDNAFSPQTAYSEATSAVAAAANSANSGASAEEAGETGGGDGQNTAGGSEGDDDIGEEGQQAPANGVGGADGLLPEPPADANIVNGSGAANFLFGSPSVDAIFAKAGHDIVHAGREGDFVYGGDGDDVLFGGAGDDMLFGEGGDDTLFGGKGDDSLDGGEGDDELFGGQGDDVLDGDAGADTLYGGGGDDALSGGAGNDALHGGGGEDILSGDAGQDTLSGGAGNDQLSGGDGSDKLFGGQGDDIVDGGAGDDILIGGAGQDTFVYRTGGGSDSILDYEEEYDHIQLEVEEQSYTVNATDYGKDYVFQNGAVLKVHGNSGKGSNNSGSGNSGSGKNNSGGDEEDGDFDLRMADNSGSGSFGDEDWSDLILSGVVEDPALASTPEADLYPPLADLYADPGLPALGISMVPFSHEDTNLIG
jgi:Ca2+-binding RTX toxin-like protein